MTKCEAIKAWIEQYYPELVVQAPHKDSDIYVLIGRISYMAYIEVDFREDEDQMYLCKKKWASGHPVSISIKDPNYFTILRLHVRRMLELQEEEV